MDLRQPPSRPRHSPSIGLDALTLAAAIDVAIASGIMDELYAEPASAEDLAARTHVVRGALEPLLAALEAGGVVALCEVSTTGPATAEPTTGRWRLVGDPTAWRSMVESLQSMGSFLDTGSRAVDQRDVTEVGQRYRSITGLLAAVEGPTALQWARRLARPGLAVLELGAGAAPFSRALLGLEPSVLPTIVDLEPVIDAYRTEITDRYPVSEIDFVAADAFSVDFDPQFDLVIVAAFCRLFGPEANRVLFERIARWLRPAGQILVVEALEPADGRSSAVSIYGLSLAMRRREGRMYSLTDFGEWLESAGFEPPVVHGTDTTTLTVLHASKPTDPLAISASPRQD